MSEYHETPPSAVPNAPATTEPAPGGDSSHPGEHGSSAPSVRGGRGRGDGGGGGGGGRGRGRGTAGGRKHKNMGRNEYNRHKDENNHRSKRAKTSVGRGATGAGWQESERQGDASEKEERKPKRKVAVMISYCGSGYKGMQLNPPHKSIEGDLFEAFVKAGAISAANSNDPKKSSLVRCARTDKGVHAAGNVISLKLIIEDPEVIPKINANLPEQIRVWDIIRTIGSFSCYQLCDSRKYEYLVPSHVFLPPYPDSYLAKICLEYAEKEGDLENYLTRQKEVEGWWPAVNAEVKERLGDLDQSVVGEAMAQGAEPEKPPPEGPEPDDGSRRTKQENPLRKKLQEIHLKEKKAYRIPAERLERVREAFRQFVGTNNFYNFTIDKSFKDASAKRHIKSFEVNDPVIANGTEWLSIHVHGQSFMMHQIRKMVGLAMMVVRTGCPVSRIQEAFGPRKVQIAKAPSLGLLLEYPVFTHYNERTAKENQRDPLDFGKYKSEIDAFKQKFIYSKIFEEEEKYSPFGLFVEYLDSCATVNYHYLTSSGFKALGDAAAQAPGGRLTMEKGPGNESEDEAIGGEEG